MAKSKTFLIPKEKTQDIVVLSRGVSCLYNVEGRTYYGLVVGVDVSVDRDGIIYTHYDFQSASDLHRLVSTDSIVRVL